MSHRVLATNREYPGIIRCNYVLPAPCLVKDSSAQVILHPEIPSKLPSSLYTFHRAVPVDFSPDPKMPFVHLSIVLNTFLIVVTKHLTK